MKVSFNRLRRSVYAVLALVVAVATIVPAFGGIAHADQVQDRYIKMSSSANAATNVSYEVGFDVATTGNVEGVVVDFCSNTPIIGDSCTAPASFSVGTPTVATSGGANTGLSGSWTAANENSGRTLTLKNSTGGSISAGGQVIFTLSTATNPATTNTSFYARIFTFDTDTDVDTWVATPNGSSTANVIDSGGVALRTAAQVTVTAKVQETLTFCVYDNVNCAGGADGIALGDANGVLSVSDEFINKEAAFDLASNAADGVTVRFKANNTLLSGANDINAIGGTPATSTPGSEQFGLCAYRSSGTLMAIDTIYDGATAAPAGECSGTVDNSGGTPTASDDNGAQFALDMDNTLGATSTYGDTIATMAAGTSETATLSFLGNIASTTPAGIYTSTLTFIATGQY